MTPLVPAGTPSYDGLQSGAWSPTQTGVAAA